MLTEVLVGTLVGIVSGFIPGIHPNLIAVMASTHPAFVVTAALAHTQSSTIPMVYLSVPTDNVLAAHPAAKLHKKGFGYEAIKLLCTGSIIGLLTAAALTPFFLAILPYIKIKIQPYIPIVLVAVIVFLILYEKTLTKKICAAGVFITAGIIGYITLNSNISEPFIPLFSGLFGIPALLANMAANKKHKQYTTDLIKPDLPQMGIAVFGSIVSVIFLTLLPAISISQSSVFATLLLRIKKYTYLILLGSITTLDYYFSLLFAVLFGKTRNGAFEVIGTEQISANFPAYLAAMIFAASVSLLVTLTAAKKIKFDTINPRLLSGSVITFLLCLTYAFSGDAGVLLLACSTTVGALPLFFNVSRTHLMGCLMVPYLIMAGW